MGKIWSMDFPSVELMERQACLQWIEEYFHPNGLKCRIVRPSWSKRFCFAKRNAAIWMYSDASSVEAFTICTVGQCLKGDTSRRNKLSCSFGRWCETGTGVENQPYHGIGSAALVASQCGMRTNDRPPERSGSRTRRNVPERWGKKEHGTGLRRIHLVKEPISVAGEALTITIDRQFVLSLDESHARYVSA